MVILVYVFIVHLNSTASRRLEQHILWLHITMYDMMIIHQHQTFQHRVSKLPNQSDTEPLELILLDQLIQVHGQQLKRYTDVVSKCEMFQHVNNVGCVICVNPPKVIQDADFLLSLSVKAFLIADHFQRNADPVPVVKGLHYLSETAFANHL